MAMNRMRKLVKVREKKRARIQAQSRMDNTYTEGLYPIVSAGRITEKNIHELASWFGKPVVVNNGEKVIRFSEPQNGKTDDAFIGEYVISDGENQVGHAKEAPFGFAR